MFKADTMGDSDNECALHLARMEAIAITKLHGFQAYDVNAPLETVQIRGEVSSPGGKVNFKAIYESSDIVHIATHGLQSGSFAWDSTISLGEKLRVVDIARLHSQASLVCFAACVSGLGEDNINNDLLGFSHAVIASGASTFLGGLWQVDDLATMILMIFFHRAIEEQKPDVSLAACWRQAQVRLYELTKPKLECCWRGLSQYGTRQCMMAKYPLKPRPKLELIFEIFLGRMGNVTSRILSTGQLLYWSDAAVSSL
jgi:hypothetical protein